MNEFQPVRLGILGAGRIVVDTVLPMLAGLSAFELVGIGTSFPESVPLHLKNMLHESYEAVISDKSCDALYIATSNNLHYELAMEALRSGKHVLCEKPIATEVEHCVELYRTALEANVILDEGFMYRHAKYWGNLTDSISGGGLIGELEFIDVNFHHRVFRKNDIRFRKDKGGGCLLDVGCYCFDVVHKIAKNPCTILSSRIWKNEAGVEYYAHVTFEAGKITGRITCGYDRELEQGLLLQGSHGTVHVDYPFINQQRGVCLSLTSNSGIKRIRLEPDNAYLTEFKEFYRRIHGSEVIGNHNSEWNIAAICQLTD
uniref:Uncharacterized protein n=1 Tax=Candidatus Kentrum sp. LPFa TaxID=2126335 RepID=A0A450VSY1_9GAMM|nr:MAG: hypothetical protein BECKLPF1236B_GA0070989_100328 [Candidatus Kentron sp. LPFa]